LLYKKGVLDRIRLLRGYPVVSHGLSDFPIVGGMEVLFAMDLQQMNSRVSKSGSNCYCLTGLIFAVWVAGTWASPQASAAAFEAQLVATGLSNPVAITQAGDGSGRLFITLQAGKVVIYDGTQVLPAPFLDITSLVASGGERGLLSVAFNPRYATNGLLYVNYTNIVGNTVVARYSVSPDPNVVDADSAVILLTVTQPFANHNGGQLQFGPDGYLYIGMGDGGSAGDPLNNAQDPSTLLGKILRIDVDSAFPYAIPADNPFVGVLGARGEIWALGLRNPWRFSFDRSTGDLFIADVGQNNWEEVNFQAAPSSGGENYGWRRMEGNHCFDPLSNCNNGGLRLPILEYDHSLGCSVPGGYRYRGTGNPELAGMYLYGDFCSGRIWAASEQGSGLWTATQILNTPFSLSTFGEDEAGELYVAHLSAPDGAIYRIVAVETGGNGASRSSGGGGGGGGCFVTAAAAGRIKAPHAEALALIGLLGGVGLVAAVAAAGKRRRRRRSIPETSC
jgi:glucose/arabinose dehydrogenase